MSSWTPHKDAGQDRNQTYMDRRHIKKCRMLGFVMSGSKAEPDLQLTLFVMSGSTRYKDTGQEADTL